ncbi:unnamed protein product [Cyprideis torosa]|uniref:Uncharacterized protein n=1 Tax=Cyprideis torosa TaxID=163714 RepID=A0A7R8WL12_9CRUS|nr:unnamed protein product [Cyprideis torosa]CAG0903844.1 unnamed protein product [Cyprideis torosa]
MNSETEKEPSGLELSEADDGCTLPKFDGIEVLSDHNEFQESGETAPEKDPGSTHNSSQTGDAPDHVEVSEGEGTVRRGKNSRDHCQQKRGLICAYEI